MVKRKTGKTCILILLSIIMTITCCSVSAFAVWRVTGDYFVRISQENELDGVLRPSIGYLGEGSYNGKTAFYVSPNATIYGSIAANVVDDYGTKDIDRLMGDFGENWCYITPVVGSGTVTKVKYAYARVDKYDSTWTYLQFNAKSGDVFYLHYYFNWHGEITSAECYFVVK